MTMRFQPLLKIVWALALFSVVAPGLLAGTAQAQGKDSCLPVEAGATYAPGTVLVGLKDAAALEAGRLAGMTVRPLADFARAGLMAARAETLPGEECAALERLREDPQVAWAELDYAAQAAVTPDGERTDFGGLFPVGRSGSEAEGGVIPNDPGWEKQWGPAQIRAPEAWSVVTGTVKTVIAVVDSGMQMDHPDLAAKLWRNPGEIGGNQIDDDGNGKIDDLHGWHFFHTWEDRKYSPEEDDNLADEFGHGTHVAGIAAAAAQNRAGIAGIAWGAPVMVVRVLDPYGSGFYSDIAGGIVYAADNGARIINLSLGGAQGSEILKEAVQYARSRGALVVAAAGNNSSPVFFPAAYAPVLAVGATDPQDHSASFSNYGPEVDLAAPGTDIYSTWYGSTRYFTKSGTSMAAPHVSGAAALVWARWPELTAGEVFERLLATADDVHTPGFDAFTGWGRVNAARAVSREAAGADLWVQTEAPTTAVAGETITYTIRFGNRGSSPVLNAKINSHLPPGLTPAGAVSWTIPELPVWSGTFSVKMPVRVSLPLSQAAEGVTLTNTVRISAGAPDVDPENDVTTSRTYITLPPQREVFVPLLVQSNFNR